MDFLDAYDRLPRVQRRKAKNVMTKFMADPTGTGLNYESIHSAGRPDALPSH